MGFLMCSSPLKAAGQAEGRLTLSSPFSIPFTLLSLYHISQPLPAEVALHFSYSSSFRKE